MKLRLNRTYTRREISKMLGGSVRAYLPFNKGKVVCGCFRKEENFNPTAPEEVLFGRDVSKPDAEKSAEIAYEQGKRGEAIPIFIRRASTAWEYMGDYRCVALQTAPSALKKKMLAHPRRGVIKGILLFEKA